jgi:predicted  nucleic acid-binding Zn-ribbon protein
MTVIQTYLVYILGILLLISVGTNVFYHFDAKALKAEKSNLTTQLDQSKQDSANKDKVISDQNSKIIDAQKQLKGFAEKFSTLSDDLHAKDIENQKLIDKMASQPAPKTCTEIKNYLKNNIDTGIYKW